MCLFPPCSIGNIEDESRIEIRCFGGNEQEESISNKHLYYYGNTKDNCQILTVGNNTISVLPLPIPDS